MMDKTYFRKRVMTMLAVLVTGFMMILPAVSADAYAAAKVDINGSRDVKGGETFTVAVTFGGGDIGRVDASMTYDTDRLTYISGGTSSGNSGYIQLKKAGTDGSVTFNLKFQALTEGKTSLDVTTVEMYDMNEHYMDEYPSASETISVSGDAEDDEIVTEPDTSDEDVEQTAPPGVDEKPDKEKEEGHSTLFMVLMIAVPLILILIIAMVLAKKKKARKRKSAKRNS